MGIDDDDDDDDDHDGCLGVFFVGY